MSSLNPATLFIGVSCLTFFVLWVLGRRIDTFKDAFAGLTSGAVAFGALLISPFFFYSAWHQAGAKERLVRENMPVSPGFGYAVGAQGGRAPRFVWRFEGLAEAKEILTDYEKQAAALGWKIERKKNGLLLQKDSVSFGVWTEPRGKELHVVIEKQLPKQR